MAFYCNTLVNRNKNLQFRKADGFAARNEPLSDMLDNLVSYGVCQFRHSGIECLISDLAAAIGLGTGSGSVRDVIKPVQRLRKYKSESTARIIGIL